MSSLQKNINELRISYPTRRQAQGISRLGQRSQFVECMVYSMSLCKEICTGIVNKSRTCKQTVVAGSGGNYMPLRLKCTFPGSKSDKRFVLSSVTMKYMDSV